jgi:hypothetical protein
VEVYLWENHRSRAGLGINTANLTRLPQIFMKPKDTRKYAALSPFQLKDQLIQLASSHAERKILWNTWCSILIRLILSFN